MRSTVLAGFEAQCEPIEGKAAHMYLDRKGIVTTAVGCNIDSEGAALALAWMIGGYRATSAEVIADHRAIKARQDLAGVGGLAARQQAVTTVRLTEGGIRDAVAHSLAAAEGACRARWAGWDTWPVDAQLGALSLCWSVGAAGGTGMAPGQPGNFPRFAAACERRDWTTAAVQCHIDEDGDGAVARRNADQLVCFANAAIVDAEHLDPEILHWPSALKAGVHEADTEPDPNHLEDLARLARDGVDP